MAEKADVLLIGPPKPRIVDGLARAFTVHKLVEAKDRDTFFAALAPGRSAVAKERSSHIIIMLPSSIQLFFWYPVRSQACLCAWVLGCLRKNGGTQVRRNAGTLLVLGLARLRVEPANPPTRKPANRSY